jgi:GNAT superfamily N-acetyltransferase
MKQESNLVHSGCAVRLAKPCDCNAMAELAGQLGYGCTGQEVRERLRQMQDASQYAVYVAELPGGQIAGWIGAYLFRSIETSSCAEINGLVVDRSVRCRGIGRRLLNTAEEWARRIGCGAVSVRSNIKRDRAHRFYIINGYEHVKTQKEFRKSL